MNNLKKVELYAYGVIVVLFVVGAILGFTLVYDGSPSVPDESVVAEDDPQTEATESQPFTYTSEEYNFSVDVPAGWRAENASIGPVPAINIFPEDQTYPEPYTHFTNVHHVSVYPEGIPTEGVFAQTRPLDISMQEEVGDNSRAYMLGNGDIFGRFIHFANTPSSWTPSGFVWSRVYVAEAEQLCQQGDAYVASNACDPLLGDEIVWAGNVDTTYSDDIQEILKSFRFTE